MKSTKQFNTELFENPQYYDVKFTFPKEESFLKANKCILAANSEVWRGQFCGENWMDSGKNDPILTICIEEADIDTFRTFLKFCYIQEIELNEENTLPIILIAEKYLQKELIQHCMECVFREKQNLGFLLRFLGRAEELAIELESITTLKQFILEIIKNSAPEIFIELDNVFSKLSISIKGVVFDLLMNEVEPMMETSKLRRIIEYGNKLLSYEEHEGESIRETMTLPLQHLDPQKLCSEGLSLLEEHLIYPISEIAKIAFSILDREGINNANKRKYHRYDLTKAIVRGTMISNTHPVYNHVGSTGHYTLDLNSKNLIIELDEVLQVFYFTLNIKVPTLIGSLEIQRSNTTASNAWKQDSIYTPLTYTRQSVGETMEIIKLAVKSHKKYRYWRIIGKTINNHKQLAGRLTIYI